MFHSFKVSRPALAATALALLVSLAPTVAAQSQTQPQPATPPATTTTQTGTADKAQTQTPTGEAVAAKAAPEPLYREYRGISLGMSAADVRAKLGKPQEKSDEMDFYVFSDRERARVYYTEGKATAVIATYIGKDGGAPPPVSVLGAEIEAKPDGSMYMMTPYKEAGYWVAYSRTAGDSPMVIITMQKTP
jgi:hypothetical protein